MGASLRAGTFHAGCHFCVGKCKFTTQSDLAFGAVKEKIVSSIKNQVVSCKIQAKHLCKRTFPTRCVGKKHGVKNVSVETERHGSRITEAFG